MANRHLGDKTVGTTWIVWHALRSFLDYGLESGATIILSKGFWVHLQALAQPIRSLYLRVLSNR